MGYCLLPAGRLIWREWREPALVCGTRHSTDAPAACSRERFVAAARMPQAVPAHLRASRRHGLCRQRGRPPVQAGGHCAGGLAGVGGAAPRLQGAPGGGQEASAGWGGAGRVCRSSQAARRLEGRGPGGSLPKRAAWRRVHTLRERAPTGSLSNALSPVPPRAAAPQVQLRGLPAQRPGVALHEAGAAALHVGPAGAVQLLGPGAHALRPVTVTRAACKA